MKIADLLDIKAISTELTSSKKIEVLAEMVDLLRRVQPDLDATELLAVLIDREELGSTGIGDGVAIPHGKIKGLDQLLMAFGRKKDGVDFDSMDNRPAFLFFLLLAPESEATLHLKALARISKLLRKEDIRRQLVDAPDPATVLSILSQED
jgi:PTS system nitrogen regulatory IIA component